MKCSKYNIKDEWVSLINLQPEEERRDLYEAMFAYMQTGKQQECPSAALSLLYSLMKTSVALSMAGRKGNKKGLRNNPNGRRGTRKEQNQNKTKTEPEQNQNKTNSSDNQLVKPILEERKEIEENSFSPIPLLSIKEDKEKKIYKRKIDKEKTGEIDDEQGCRYANDFALRFPRCMGMRQPLTYKQYCSLRTKIMDKEHVSISRANKIITMTLEKLENIPDLNKRYVSTSRVLLNWYDRGFLTDMMRKNML